MRSMKASQDHAPRAFRKNNWKSMQGMKGTLNGGSLSAKPSSTTNGGLSSANASQNFACMFVEETVEIEETVESTFYI